MSGMSCTRALYAQCSCLPDFDIPAGIRQRHQIHLKDDEARKAAEQRFGSAFYTADVLDCLYDLYKDSVADENMCK